MTIRSAAAAAIRKRAALKALRTLQLTPEEAAAALEEIREEKSKQDELIRVTDAERIATRDEEALFKLGAFVRGSWEIMYPGTPLVWNWHMDAVCDELQYITDESRRRTKILHWCIEQSGGDEHAQRELTREHLGDMDPLRLVINIPPRHSKSTLVSVCWQAWVWLHDPGHKVIATARSSKVVIRDSRAMKKIINSEWYRKLADTAADRRDEGTWRLAGDQQEKSNFENAYGGYRKCAPLRAGITGEGADGILIDDPIDAKEAYIGSQDQIVKRMTEVVEIYDHALEDRLNDPRAGYIVLIMQVLHPLDLSEVLKDRARRHAEGLDGGQAIRYLVLPTEYDPTHPYLYPKDPRTEVGQMLNEARYDSRWAAAEKSKGIRQWMAKYQQKPVASEAGQIKKEWLKYYTDNPFDVAAACCDDILISVDSAKKKGKTACLHAIVVVGKGNADMPVRRLVLDRYADKFTYPEFEAVMLDVIKLWRARRPLARKVRILLEDNSNATVFYQTWEGKIPDMILFNPSDMPGKDKGKEARFTFAETCAESGNLWFPDVSLESPFEPEFVSRLKECRDLIASFPGGAYADDADALSQALVYWNNREKEEGGETPLDRIRKRMGISGSAIATAARKRW